MRVSGGVGNILFLTQNAGYIMAYVLWEVVEPAGVCTSPCVNSCHTHNSVEQRMLPCSLQDANCPYLLGTQRFPRMQNFQHQNPDNPQDTRSASHPTSSMCIVGAVLDRGSCKSAGDAALMLTLPLNLITFHWLQVGYRPKARAPLLWLGINSLQ